MLLFDSTPLTGLKDGFIGATSGAIFGPGAAVGAAFGRKMAMAGAEGAFTSVMDQLLRGEKINWKTVAMDAGIGMFTLGILDNKYAKKLGGFIGKIGDKTSLKSVITKGMDKAAVGYQKMLNKFSELGNALGKKMKDLGQNVADKAKDLNQKAKKLGDSIEQQNKLANEKLRQQVQNAAENLFGPKNNYAFAGNTTSPNVNDNIPNTHNSSFGNGTGGNGDFTVTLEFKEGMNKRDLA